MGCWKRLVDGVLEFGKCAVGAGGAPCKVRFS